MGKTRNAYRILVGKPEVGRPRRRWVDNIKMDLRKIEWDGTKPDYHPIHLFSSVNVPTTSLFRLD
jgi:hypothetical protein